MPQLKFLVDACVDVRLTRWLRDQGHDARHLRDEASKNSLTKQSLPRQLPKVAW